MTKKDKDLLDDFARSALPAVFEVHAKKDLSVHPPSVASDCYALARAMFEERAKEPPE